VNEELLSFIWSNQLYKKFNLCSIDGEPIQVESCGQLNTDAGPDFSNARIRFSDALLVGNVELHVRSSDWLKHGHQNDPAYSTIILHVVFIHDANLDINCPELELKPRVSERLLERFDFLRSQLNPIPCSPFLAEITALQHVNWLDRWLVERLDSKSRQLEKSLHALKGDWKKLLQEQLIRSFGFVVNRVPFEILARQLNNCPVNAQLISETDRQALLLGIAGFLTEDASAGLHNLVSRYDYLKHKWALKEMPVTLWKFHRMRPANAPCRRVSQAANLLANLDLVMEKALKFEHVDELLSVLHCRATDYWTQHIKPHTPCDAIGAALGRASRERILENALLPFLFLYGHRQHKPELVERVLESYQSLPAEQNSVIKKWKLRGIQPENAADSQALIHGYKLHCLKKDCLSCSLGKQLLGKQKTSIPVTPLSEGLDK